jgi:hypothetical protein
MKAYFFSLKHAFHGSAEALLHVILTQTERTKHLKPGKLAVAVAEEEKAPKGLTPALECQDIPGLMAYDHSLARTRHTALPGHQGEGRFNSTFSLETRNGLTVATAQRGHQFSFLPLPPPPPIPMNMFAMDMQDCES